MKCPICGQEANMVGPKHTPWQSVAYRCSSHGEYNFSSDSPEALRDSESAIGESKANARRYASRRGYD